MQWHKPSLAISYQVLGTGSLSPYRGESSRSPGFSPRSYASNVFSKMHQAYNDSHVEPFQITPELIG